MAMSLQLFVVATLAVVIYSAPHDPNESTTGTTVGNRPLPATLSKKNDDSKESSESKDDIKRVSRETPHFISGVPTPTSTQSSPTNNNNNQRDSTTDQRRVRSAEETRNPPLASSGSTQYPSQNNQYPQRSTFDQNERRNQPLGSTYRQQRDVNQKDRPQIRPLPAKIDKVPTQNQGRNGQNKKN